MRKSGAFESLRRELVELQEDLVRVARRLEGVRRAAAEVATELDSSPVPSAASFSPVSDETVERVVKTALARVGQTQSPQKAYLNTREVAELVGVSPRLLDKWRRTASPDGPPFLRLGRRVLYPIAELDKHFSRKLVRATR